MPRKRTILRADNARLTDENLYLRLRVMQLEDGLRRTAQRADIEARAGAPAGMIRVYVQAEVRHTLAGHDRGTGVDCLDCIGAKP